MYTDTLFSNGYLETGNEATGQKNTNNNPLLYAVETRLKTKIQNCLRHATDNQKATGETSTKLTAGERRWLRAGEKLGLWLSNPGTLLMADPE